MVVNYSLFCLQTENGSERSMANMHPRADTAKCQLAAAGVAAAWRLGQWDVLPAYIERTDVGYDSLEPEDRWEVSRSCEMIVQVAPLT